MANPLNLEPQWTDSLEFDLRGDIELDVPALVTDDNVAALMDRGYLGELITGAGLVKREGPFPETFTEIERIAGMYPGDIFEVYGLVDGDRIAYSADLLERAIYTCGGKGGYDPSEFTLYHPTGSSLGDNGFFPAVLVADYTPEIFVIHRLFGDEESFLERFGAGACPNCETEFDELFVDCPECGQRPDSVQQNIDRLQEEHHGVLVAIAPKMMDLDDVDEGLVRRAGEMPDPQIDVIESPGAAN